MAKGSSLEGFVDMLVELVSERLKKRVAEIAGSAGSKKSRAGRGAGRKLDMRCRYPACKNRSKGPRFRFLCDEHLKLPKKAQAEALAKWAK